MKWTALIVLLLAAALLGCTQQAQESTKSPAATNTAAPGSDSVAAVREISVTAERFSFSPNPITVSFGERVKLNITSTDVTHGFSLPEFGINETIAAGQTVTVEFTADKRGTFEFSCSVFCGEGHSGMKGSLVVD